MTPNNNRSLPPVCIYEGSDYQDTFWRGGGRAYEDAAEAIALKRLLPPGGRLLLELGAGAGRNTPRYHGFERIVLVDFSTTQLQQAQEHLGVSDRYVYVAADIYRLPLVDSLFDSATMIRTLHHMADAPAALGEVQRVLQKDAAFVLEFANKQNLKAILRYLLRRQEWNPFSPQPVEFTRLNFDFHPRTVFNWLEEAGFLVEKKRTVSHFRLNVLKRLIPARILAWLDGVLQPTGALWQLSPSVFLRARNLRQERKSTAKFDEVLSYFKCPECGHTPLNSGKNRLSCSKCKRGWPVTNGIHDFRVGSQA